LKYTLNYPQSKYVLSKHKYPCIKGTWGCGKSLATLLAADKECTEHPNNLYPIIRKEYIDLKNSTMKDWDNWIGKKITGNEVRYENGSTVLFIHGDDLNSFKNANFGGAAFVQAEEMTEDDFWFMNGRLRRKEGTRQLRIECNYDGHNWIYKMGNVQNMFDLITTNTFDNEKHLPPDYIQSLMKLPKRLQERHLYGSDADMEGLVWDEFSAGRHLIAPFDVPKGWDRIVVLDHGMTNPTAVLWGAIDFDGNIFIIDEHYEAGKIVSHHADIIKSRDNSSVKEWLIDPSCSAKDREKNGQQYSVIEEYRDNGLFFIPANNEVLGGLNRVSEYFKSDRLKIFKSCTNLIEEIGQYKWQKLKPGVQKNAPEAPMKHKDHACDCLRYLISSRPESPIEKKVTNYADHAEIIFNPFVPVQEEPTVEYDFTGEVAN
jgi:PBSX family phage terminase large subunit